MTIVTDRQRAGIQAERERDRQREDIQAKRQTDREHIQAERQTAGIQAKRQTGKGIQTKDRWMDGQRESERNILEWNT